MILGTFGTILYLAILSSQAAHKDHRPLNRSLKSEKNLSNCEVKIRGVNLGGWLVLEPWITPSIFEEVNVGRLNGAILGGFLLEFVSISRVINNMTCCNSSALIGRNYSIQTGEQNL